MEVPEKELPHDPEISVLGINPKEKWPEKIHAPQCSLQHCLQESRHGNNLNFHRQMNG